MLLTQFAPGHAMAFDRTADDLFRERIFIHSSSPAISPHNVSFRFHMHARETGVQNGKTSMEKETTPAGTKVNRSQKRRMGRTKTGDL
jgi:hypothetical protein